MFDVGSCFQAERFTEKRDMAHKTMHTLTSELKSVKLALEEITKRERQVRRVHVVGERERAMMT